MDGDYGVPVEAGLVEPFGYGLASQDWVPVATPVAGANASFTVEGRNWLRVVAAVATLATDANVANRVFSLDFINARGTTYLRNFAPLVVTAGTAATVFHWQEQVTQSEWAVNTPVKVPVSSLFLPPGTTVQFTVDNKQAGDQISAIFLTVERFTTGPGGYAVGFVPDAPEMLAQAIAQPHLPAKSETTTPFPPASEQG